MGLSINRKQTKLAVRLDHAGARSEHTGGLSLVPQPGTRPISIEQPVKGIYAGLVMVKAKCIDIDETQPVATEWNRSSKEVGPGSAQWHALIALHKTLLHEHHDFFLASQHPSASPAPSNIASKYAMPAIIWNNWIHAFLEPLRRRLPGSQNRMLAFNSIAYSMMTLLYETVLVLEDTWIEYLGDLGRYQMVISRIIRFYETVPNFEITWIECLGDLGRYRMAIEVGEPTAYAIWSRVANKWYETAARKRPSTSPLYRHLAILARPSTSERLDSIRCFLLRLFNPTLDADNSCRRSLLEADIVHVHAAPFCTDYSSVSRWLTILDQQLGPQAEQVQTILRLKGMGLNIALPNFALLSNFGSVPQGIFNPGSMLGNEVSSGLEHPPNTLCQSVSRSKWMKFIQDSYNIGGVFGDKTSERPSPEDYTLRGQSSTRRCSPPISFLPAVVEKDAKHDSNTTLEFFSPRERLKCLGIWVSRSSVQLVALDA